MPPKRPRENPNDQTQDLLEQLRALHSTENDEGISQDVGATQAEDVSSSTSGGETRLIPPMRKALVTQRGQPEPPVDVSSSSDNEDPVPVRKKVNFETTATQEDPDSNPLSHPVRPAGTSLIKESNEKEPKKKRVTVVVAASQDEPTVVQPSPVEGQTETRKPVEPPKVQESRPSAQPPLTLGRLKEEIPACCLQEYYDLAKAGVPGDQSTPLHLRRFAALITWYAKQIVERKGA